MADNSFSGIVGSMMKGMEGFLSSKTVVGEPTQIGDTTIIPLVDVTFGVGAGASTKDNKNSGGGGMSGKMTPSAVLVVKNGQVKLVNIKNQDTVTKVLDMIPDLSIVLQLPRKTCQAMKMQLKLHFQTRMNNNGI